MLLARKLQRELLGLRTFLHAHQRHIGELDLIRGLVDSDRHLVLLWRRSQKVLCFADACCARLNKVGHDFGGGIIAPTHYDSQCRELVTLCRGPRQQEPQTAAAKLGMQGHSPKRTLQTW
jgi:hypothetical protein